MIFSPKIFISSTIKENIELREKIKEYFESIGVEPLLYEYNLTPSTKPLTYRTDILSSDFIILIIKDEYGTKTKSGFSGIHEEYRIARNNEIPVHVYLKKNKGRKSRSNQLIKELKNDGISYYYFEDDDELLTQLKRTTFTIAKEITLNKVTQNKLPRDTIIKLACNTDYKRAMEVISIIDSMYKVSQLNELDLVHTNIFVTCLESIQYEFPTFKHGFINWKIDDLLQQMLEIANEFIEHSIKDYVTTGVYREYNISILGKISIGRLKKLSEATWTTSNYQNCLKKFFDKFEEFKRLIQDIKMEADIME